MTLTAFRSVAISLMLTMTVMAHAQDAPSTARAPTAKERSAAIAGLQKLPDWNGIWVYTFSRGPRREPPAPTPAYDAKHQELAAEQAKGNDAARASNCLPPGMPSIMTQPYNVEFLFTPGRVTIVQEAYMQVRRVFTDGRPHPENVELSFNGHSIGHWEGDTLVIDTVAIKPVTMFNQTYFHSDKLRIKERIHLKDADTMEDEMTLEDPEALTKPWTTMATFKRHREWEQIEFICEENNRNPVDESGKTHYLLRQ
jgi:hypothetical protein